MAARQKYKKAHRKRRAGYRGVKVDRGSTFKDFIAQAAAYDVSGRAAKGTTKMHRAISSRRAGTFGVKLPKGFGNVMKGRKPWE